MHQLFFSLRRARSFPFASLTAGSLAAGMTLLCLAVGAHAATWQQKAEPQPVATAKPEAAEVVLPEPANAAWIWGPDNDTSYRLTKAFAGNCERAVLVASGDNRMQILLNGNVVAESSAWDQPIAVDVTEAVKDGDNELTAIVANDGGIAGFACRLVLTEAGGGTRVVETDDSWTAAVARRPDKAVDLRVVAQAGAQPWGDVLKRATAAPPPSRVRRSRRLCSRATLRGAARRTWELGLVDHRP
jgi:hypothetical protein